MGILETVRNGAPSAGRDRSPSFVRNRAPSESGAGGRGRLRELDVLRICAALGVLFFHYTARHHDYWGVQPVEAFPTLGRISAYGYLGVNLFFLISGFVILMSAWDRTPTHFVASRIGRLYPAYWLAVIVTGTVLALWPESKGVQPMQALVNLTMLHRALGIESVDGVYWTLWVELRFYVLVGLAMWWGLTYRRLLGLVAAWLVGGIIVEQADNELLETLLVPAYAPYFAAGILFFLIHRFGGNPLLWAGVGVTYILCLHRELTRAVDYLPEIAGVPHSSIAVGGIITACFGLLALVATGRLAWMRWRVLTTVGALTYPLYLLHEHIGWFLIAHLHGSLGRWPTLLITTGLMLGLAYLVYRFVERPLGPRLRALALDCLRVRRGAG